jgi:hypothetical protein
MQFRPPPQTPHTKTGFEMTLEQNYKMLEILQTLSIKSNLHSH